MSSVEQFSGPLSRTHPKAFGVLLDRLYARVSELASKESSATYYRMALAYATATRCRHRVLTGHKKCQPEWLTAADSVPEVIEALAALGEKPQGSTPRRPVPQYAGLRGERARS